MRNHDIWLFALLLSLPWAGCSGDEALRSGAVPEDRAGACGLDADCPTGLICQAPVCVSPEDMLPPDQEEARLVGRPAASRTRLFTLATDQAALLVLHPDSLRLEAVPVPAGREALVVVPDREVALVLSGAARALTWVDMEGGTDVKILRLARRFHTLSVSSDGAWAVLWTPSGTVAEDGAEGLVALIDLDALSQGEPALVEIAAGFRHTDVHFVHDGSRAVQAVIIAKASATVVRLDSLSDPGYRPQRLVLPPAFAEVIGREVVATPGSDVLLMRSLGAPALGVFSVFSSTVAAVSLPGLATDLDLSADGRLAVVALRGRGQVGLLPLPEVLTATEAVRYIDVPAVSPGQVELSLDGLHAAVFSAQDGSERFGWLSLGSGELTVYDQIDKQVRSIVLSPDGLGAMVLHQADPDSSAADLYERAVDQDEGYSLVDLTSGFAQLKRTGAAPAVEVAFGASGRWAAVTVLDEVSGDHRVEAADLSTLIVHSLSLASAPRFLGALPSSEQVWITQVHPAGRISVFDLQSERLQTLTGFQLNAEIVSGGGQ